MYFITFDFIFHHYSVSSNSKDYRDNVFVLGFLKNRVGLIKSTGVKVARLDSNKGLIFFVIK